MISTEYCTDVWCSRNCREQLFDLDETTVLIKDMTLKLLKREGFNKAYLGTNSHLFPQDTGIYVQLEIYIKIPLFPDFPFFITYQLINGDQAGEVLATNIKVFSNVPGGETILKRKHAREKVLKNLNDISSLIMDLKPGSRYMVEKLKLANLLRLNIIDHKILACIS